MSLLIPAVLALLAAAAYYVISFYRNVARYPKGPTPLPIFGNSLQIQVSKISDEIARMSEEYGSVFTLFLPKPIVIITDYAAFKEAFVQKGEDFVDRPVNLLSQELNFCPNGGVIRSNGENWREQRRAAISILRDFGMGKSIMEEKVKESAEEYLRCLAAIKDKEAVDMRWPIQLMIANIINEVLFDHKYDYDDCAPLIDYVEGFNKLLNGISGRVRVVLAMSFPWMLKVPVIGYHAIGKHLEHKNKLFHYIEEEVARAKKSYKEDGEPDCFVHAYMQRMKRNAMLNNDQMYACCNDFFLAGQETTTTTLRWAMLLLAANQDVQDKIRAEILSVVGKSRLPSMADRPRLHYTSAAVFEVQRRANILAMNVQRVAVVDTEVQGFKIPAGSNVDGDIHQIMAHDPLFKDPMAFRPERYLMEDGKTFNKDLVDRTVPFSLGKRQCAGEGLARVELFIGLAATLQNYHILPLADGTEIDLEPQPLNIRLPKPQKVRIVPVV